MKKSVLDFIGNIPIDLLSIAIGILFLIHSDASWKILYVIVLIFLLYSAAAVFISIYNHDKEKTKTDVKVIIFDVLFSLYMILFPQNFLSWATVFVGWWILAHAILDFINFYVYHRDHLREAPTKLFSGLFSTLFASFLILSPNMGNKSWLLAAAAGIYFCFYGGASLIQHLNIMQKDLSKKHQGWTVSLPIILNVFLPLQAYVSINSLLKETDTIPPVKNTPHDLDVYLYLNEKGPESFGHLDIAYQGVIYSYGCHDPLNRHLVGTLGDGVLIVSDEKSFVRNALHGENKIVLDYGIVLTQEEKNRLQKRIDEMMSRTTPWLCLAAEAEKNHQDTSDIKDYASRVYKNTHAAMYKFTNGKFRTYFAGSTNCVLLADELIRNPDLRLIDLNGFVTPGSYLSFLNYQYLVPGSIVVSRQAYQSGKLEI